MINTTGTGNQNKKTDIIKQLSGKLSTDPSICVTEMV